MRAKGVEMVDSDRTNGPGNSRLEHNQSAVPERRMTLPS